MTRTFQRTIEDFRCLNCGTAVTGDGYTNHCPICLCSRHVDDHPGDRKSDCLGMMEPIGLEKRQKGWRILHRCQNCGSERWNRSAAEDDFDVLISLVGEQKVSRK